MRSTAQLVGYALADDIQLALEVVGAHAFAGCNEYLPHLRFAGLRRRSDHAVVPRHLSDTEQALSFLCNHASDMMQRRLEPVALGREKEDSCRVATPLGQ